MKNYQDEWKRTVNGKLLVFWLFTVLLPIGCIIAIVESTKLIKMGNKPMIALLVFAIIDLIILIVDIYAVASKKSSGLLVGMGVFSILSIGLVIQGIFMILIADYVELPSDEEYAQKIKAKKEKTDHMHHPVVTREDYITSWKYYKYAEMLELHFDNKVVAIYDIQKDFIKKVWKVMPAQQQTAYYFKFWHNK